MIVMFGRNLLQLLQVGEIQPGITAQEFAHRRKNFTQMMQPNSLAIIGSSPTVYMAGVIPYAYRPDSDFQYMTGIIQPECVATVDCKGVYTLYYPDYSEYRNTWTGALMSKDAAIGFFGADEAYSTTEMKHHLRQRVSDASHVYIDMGSGTPALMGSEYWRNTLDIVSEVSRDSDIQLLATKPVVNRLRWVKSPAEIELMRKSARIGASAMIDAIAATKPGMTEHDIAALFEYRCKAQGAQRMAYPPVVGSGSDACTIHYSRNDKILLGDNLLLLDGGCEYYGYCSDITRTWPINGKLEGPQRTVYDIVFAVHKELLGDCRAGTTLRSLHQKSVALLREGLRYLGSSSRGHYPLLEKNNYRNFYPHSVGHWLGMDTHDSSTVSHDLPLRQGVALTIEPGIYIPDIEEFGPYRGIGIRLEDDVVISKSGEAEILSGDAPLDPDDLAQLMIKC